MDKLEPLFVGTVMFRHRRFEECIAICDQLLEKNPRDQVSSTV